MKKRLLVVLVSLVFALSLPAVHEDMCDLAGSQYSLDRDAFLSFFLGMLVPEEPCLDHGFISELVRAEAGDFDISLIFLSQDEMLIAMTGGAPVKRGYRLYERQRLFAENRCIGTFSDDYAYLDFVIEGLPLRLVRVE